MPASEISAAAIGEIAQELLAQAQPASVMGNTSRGLFIHLASGWVIFLSFETHHGPLTLNLVGNPEALAGLEIGSSVTCLPIELSFPSLRLSLPLAQAHTWQVPTPPAHILPLDAMRTHLLTVVRLAAQKHTAGALQLLLPAIVDRQPPTVLPDREFYPRWRRLQAACRERQTQAVVTAVESWLGLGPGLTPSGDDLALGFLLALNRWGERLSVESDIDGLNQEIPRRARRLTSALSASLIACAARGQADQHLIVGLDSIVTGKRDAGECVTSLSGWGSSSGLDALVGMALALLDCPLRSESLPTRG